MMKDNTKKINDLLQIQGLIKKSKEGNFWKFYWGFYEFDISTRYFFMIYIFDIFFSISMETKTISEID